MTRIRIGVIGCGAIAQIQHLPFLTELAEEFEVGIVKHIGASRGRHRESEFAAVGVGSRGALRSSVA